MGYVCVHVFLSLLSLTPRSSYSKTFHTQSYQLALETIQGYVNSVSNTTARNPPIPTLRRDGRLYLTRKEIVHTTLPPYYILGVFSDNPSCSQV